MSINLSRRGLLRMLGAVAPAAILAPTYFFAPVGGWKSETIVNPNYRTYLAGKDAIIYATTDTMPEPPLIPNAVFEYEKAIFMMAQLLCSAPFRSELHRKGYEVNTRAALQLVDFPLRVMA